jgi:hypothetical protein
LALLGFVLLAQFAAVVGREDAEPRTPRRPRPAPAARTAAFPYVADSPGLIVSADVEVPVEELRQFGEQALRELRTWLDGGRAHFRAPHYKAYFCAELETMRWLETTYGQPRSDPAPFRTFEYRGGFYEDVDLILLQCQPGDDLRWNLGHELCHAVWEERVGTDCDVLDEGLACYAQAKLLGIPQAAYGLDGQPILPAEVPTLAQLFALDYWQFRDATINDRNFVLSWALARLLLEDERPEIAGRFPALLAALQAVPPWDALVQVYERSMLEPAWREAVERWTTWLPVFGAWSLEAQRFEAKNDEPGSVLLIHRDRPLHARPFRLSAQVDPSTPALQEMGFALGFQSSERYYAVSLRLPEGLVVAEHLDEGWGRGHFVPVAELPRDWSTAELVLDVSASGELTLTFGARVLAGCVLGEGAFRGGIGLFAIPAPSDGGRGGSVVYSRVSLDLDPAETNLLVPEPR